MDNAQWQRRLEKIIADSPALQDALSSITRAEEEYKEKVLGKLFGYQALCNCFQGFTANTVSLIENQLREHPRLLCPHNYILLLLRITACLQTFRAANNAFLIGYPWPGFAILRNVKDWAIMIAAVGNGLTSLTMLNGLEQASNADASLLPKVDLDAARKRRMKEERRILEKMLRTADSGLDDSVRKALRTWEDLFNMEVHAAIGYTALEGISRMNGQDTPSLLHSSFSKVPMLNFTNRACEVGWMILKLLPLLQIRPGQFDEDWAETWKILDESFQFFSLGVAAERKPIGTAILELLEKKFNFRPEYTCYMESMA